MNNCIGIINLDENEEGLSELTKHRSLASLPIAGRYRVVDFVKDKFIITSCGNCTTTFE